MLEENCPKCKLPSDNVDLDAMICSGFCNTAWHRQCANVTKTCFELVKSKKNYFWYCDRCALIVSNSLWKDLFRNSNEGLMALVNAIHVAVDGLNLASAKFLTAPQQQSPPQSPPESPPSSPQQTPPRQPSPVLVQQPQQLKPPSPQPLLTQQLYHTMPPQQLQQPQQLISQQHQPQQLPPLQQPQALQQPMLPQTMLLPPPQQLQAQQQPMMAHPMLVPQPLLPSRHQQPILLHQFQQPSNYQQLHVQQQSVMVPSPSGPPKPKPRRKNRRLPATTMATKLTHPNIPQMNFPFQPQIPNDYVVPNILFPTFPQSLPSQVDFPPLPTHPNPVSNWNNNSQFANVTKNNNNSVKHIFVSRLSLITTEQNVFDFFLSSLGVRCITCHKIKGRTNMNPNFLSFKVGITNIDFARIIQQRNWPQGMIVREFIDQQTNFAVLPSANQYQQTQNFYSH
jgi:hypothetical protein